MTHEQMIERLQAECDTLIATVRAKNGSYGNDSAGPFHNFNIIEFLTDGQISAEVGIIVRLTDKLARAYNLMVGQPDNVGEALTDTLRDAAAYSLLALIVHDSKHDLDEKTYTVTQYSESVPYVDPGGEAAPLNEKQQGAWASLVETMRKWS